MNYDLSLAFVCWCFSDNPAYRRGSDGIILGPDFKRGSIYSDNLYPTSAPPRPPTGKRASMNGHVNPGLSLREDIVTMNPLYEGQMVEHKDLEALNCSDFGVHPDQIVLEERKNPESMYNKTESQSSPFIRLLHQRTNEFIHGILISFFFSIFRSRNE